MTLPNVWVRIIVGVTLIPVVLFLTWSGGLYFLMFVAVFVAIGMWEFYRMVGQKGIEPNRLLGMIASLCICWSAWRHDGQAILGITVGAVILIASVEIFRKQTESAILNISTTLLGILYIGWMGSHLLLLRALPGQANQLTPQDGLSVVLIAFLIPWCCDTAAYFTGRLIGRHKLIPRVSAGKTVEGALGGLVGAVLGLFAFNPYFFAYLSSMDCLVLGLVGGAISQVGDLAESLLKRDAGIKDSSQIIPGHGGVLDRFDSVLFSAPFVYYYLTLIVL